jgi:hypothetical protein
VVDVVDLAIAAVADRSATFSTSRMSSLRQHAEPGPGLLAADAAVELHAADADRS